jgi:hypothetical protein
MERRLTRSLSVTDAGSAGAAMVNAARDLGEGAIYWSPRLASALEQAVVHTRVLDQSSVSIPGASLYSDARSDLTVGSTASCSSSD